MNYIVTNALAISIAAAGGLLISALFHRSAKPCPRSSNWPVLVITVVAEAWLASILAGALLLAPAAGPGAWTMALASAVVIWIGFVLPTTLVSLLHAGYPSRTTITYAAHWLIVMVVQAAILQAVGLIKPS